MSNQVTKYRRIPKDKIFFILKINKNKKIIIKMKMSCKNKQNKIIEKQ